MKYHCNLVVILCGMVSLYMSAATLNRDIFLMKRNLGREKLTNYLSKVLCSIDVKFVTIYYEFEEEGRLLDGVLTENSGCTGTHSPVTIFA